MVRDVTKDDAEVLIRSALRRTLSQIGGVKLCEREYVRWSDGAMLLLSRIVRESTYCKSCEPADPPIQALFVP